MCLLRQKVISRSHNQGSIKPPLYSSMNSNSELTIVNLVLCSVKLIVEYFYMHKEMNFKRNSIGLTVHVPSYSLL